MKSNSHVWPTSPVPPVERQRIRTIRLKKVKNLKNIDSIFDHKKHGYTCIIRRFLSLYLMELESCWDMEKENNKSSMRYDYMEGRTEKDEIWGCRQEISKW
ncbi:Hypothetical predicted protein [Mytilus galloprovincialis]|uniref:Uncharacterized protein n=1 Tax=Mytilus galloprovincialis TaxID=29158 RepID=A0A8B6ERT7_MYTGA|nr:Hypothetical predicted protein [Mytilus galloprovincialis]